MKDNIKLMLLGDTFKAQALIPFAERKLRMLRQFMELINLETASRLYEFKPDGSTVYIESIFGYEKIRIVGRKEIVCPTFTATPLTGAKPLTVTFKQHNINKKPHTFYDFNDNTYAENVDVFTGPFTHVYRNAGIYSPQAQYNTNPVYVNLSSKVFNKIQYRKRGHWKSGESDAWDEYKNESFTQIQGNLESGHYLEHQGVALYRYSSYKFTCDIDLTEFDGSINLYWAFPFDSSFAFGTVKRQGGPQSSLGGSIDSVNANDESGGIMAPFYRLVDLTPWAGTIITGFTITDNLNYSRITAPFSNFNGWSDGGNYFRNLYYISKTKCLTRRQDYIEVS